MSARYRVIVGVLVLASAALLVGAVVVVAGARDFATAAVLAALAVVLLVLADLERRAQTDRSVARRHHRQLRAARESIDRLRSTAADQQEQLTRLRRQVAQAYEQNRQLGSSLHEDLQTAVSSLHEDLRAADSSRREDLQLEARERALTARNSVIASVVEQSALANLVDVLRPRGLLPAPTDFSAMPSTVLSIVTEILGRSGEPLVVECGSGASTVWFALACRHRGGGRVVALEHDARWARQTRAALESCGVADMAEVREVPLELVEIDGEDYRWYAPAALEGLGAVDVLFVDGPPGSSGPLARYPALPMLADALSPDALVVMDDEDRAEERASTARWLEDEAVRLTRVGTHGRAVFYRWRSSPG